MFTMKQYSSVDSATMHVWDYIRTFAYGPFDSNSTFIITHSINQDDKTCESVNFDSFYENLLNFLRDLDSQEGLYFDNEEGKDFDESDAASDKIYKELHLPGRKYECGLSGEGILVIKNTFSAAPGEYLFVVLKPSLYQLDGSEILKSLKNNNPFEDYTSKVCPAIYVQLDKR